MHGLTVYGIETIFKHGLLFTTLTLHAWPYRLRYWNSPMRPLNPEIFSAACMALPFTVLKRIREFFIVYEVNRAACMALPFTVLKQSCSKIIRGVRESCMHGLTVYGIETSTSSRMPMAWNLLHAWPYRLRYWNFLRIKPSWRCCGKLKL